MKHLLVSFSCHELNVEHQRQQLAVYEQFSLYSCFRRIVANERHKTINVTSMYQFLHDNSFNWVSTKDVTLLFKEFNLRDEETDLNFGEFSRIFLSRESDELRAALSQRELSDKAYMPLKLEQGVSELLAKEIEFLQSSHTLRVELQ